MTELSPTAIAIAASALGAIAGAFLSGFLWPWLREITTENRRRKQVTEERRRENADTVALDLIDFDTRLMSWIMTATQLEKAMTSQDMFLDTLLAVPLAEPPPETLRLLRRADLGLDIQRVETAGALISYVPAASKAIQLLEKHRGEKSAAVYEDVLNTLEATREAIAQLLESLTQVASGHVKERVRFHTDEGILSLVNRVLEMKAKHQGNR